MYAAGNGFINTLRWGSFLVAAQLTTIHKGVNTQILLPVSVANFTIDRNAAQRRTGELTVEIIPTVPPSTISVAGVLQQFLPTVSSSPLSPFGNEIFVQLTVMDQTGAFGSKTAGVNGWVPMGTYAIAGATVDDSGIDMAVTLDLYDRSWIFSRWTMLKDYTVPAADSTLEGEIKAILSSTWNSNGPGRSVAGSTPVPSWITSPNISTNSYVVPAGTYQQGQDPWQVCLDMAAGAGFELFFDVNGTLTGTPMPGSPASIALGFPTLSQLPVNWGFNPGEVSAQGSFAHPLGGTPFTSPVAASFQTTRDKIYNDYFVSAVGPSNAGSATNPTQAEALDTNANSPTYVNGEIGDIPYFIYDSSINTAGQALIEAQYQLAVSTAKAQTVSVTSPLNPLFDVDDVATLLNPRWGGAFAIDPGQKFIVDTISTGIRYDVHTILTGRVIVPGS